LDLWQLWQSLVSGQDFMPRRLCGVWSPSLIALHLVSDGVIWLSYLWIPVVMLLAYRTHRRELRLQRATFLLFLLYALFITACGWTHFFDGLMFYNPVYRLNGFVRALTAAVSLVTAVSLARLIPRAVNAPITILAQEAALAQQQTWLRDILDAATSGVLRLCASPEDLPAPLNGETSEAVTVAAVHDLAAVRRLVRGLAEGAGFERGRVQDLVTAAHEAAMNALNHAGAGVVRGFHAGDRVQIWVRDSGPGIALDRLPISTLKQGYSTAGTGGQGWFQILSLVDTAYLLTGPDGTTVVLEQGPTRPEPSWA